MTTLRYHSCFLRAPLRGAVSAFPAEHSEKAPAPHGKARLCCDGESSTVLCYYLTLQIGFRDLLWPSHCFHKHYGTKLSYIKYNLIALGKKKENNKAILHAFYRVKHIFRMVVSFLPWSPEIAHQATHGVASGNSNSCVYQR